MVTLAGKNRFIKYLLPFAFFGTVVFIRWWTEPTLAKFGTVKVWDRNNILLYESAGNVGKKIPITYDQLPRHLINATVAAEDASFWTNPGIDLKAIVRAIYLNLTRKKIVSGASTITQQLARIAVISPQRPAPVSFVRKIREMLIALRLTLSYSKEEILTLYLNQIYYGNLAYGVQAGAHVYFAKDLSQLSLAESAFLTGLLSSPGRQNPFASFTEAKRRQIQVLKLMVNQGFISQDKAEEAKQENLALVENNLEIKAPHFVHFVLQEKEKMGIDSSEGINIYTTLDHPTFLLSEEIARIWVDRLRDKHDLSNAALVLLKNDTGEILTMLGGIDYFAATNAGEVNMTTALRQPGSALKPITYAAAFKQEHTPATLIYDVKKVYKTKKGEGFTPNNYDGRYHGLVLVREALASSYNLPAVEMLNRIGLDKFLQVARDLGITTLRQEDRYDLALTLGGGEVKLLELTNVYASFARGGIYKSPYTIQRVTADSGKVLYEYKPEPEIQVLGNKGEQVAYLISDILSDPKARIPGFGEKNPLVLSRPAAAKTGTTTDWHDNWTVGYTPDYTVGVWVGNNDNHSMRDLSGIVGAAPIWQQFFEEYLKGKPVKQFIKPAEIKEIEICKVSGKLPDDLCPEKAFEIFIEGTEPTEKSNIHKKVKIDKRNGLRAADTCPASFVEEKIFVDYPPEVYSWALEEQLEVIPKQTSPLYAAVEVVEGEVFLEIVYPREKTVFEYAPLLVDNQGIVFEVNVSANIDKVSWYINGDLLRTITAFPFKISWEPKVGEHTIKAIGETSDRRNVESEERHISVVEYEGTSKDLQQ